jgi:hypothetical protein
LTIVARISHELAPPRIASWPKKWLL